MNTLMLKGKMVERGYTQDSLSVALKMNRATLNRKLSANDADSRGFTIGEACAIAKTLPLTASEAMQIFFADVVADTRQ